MGRGSSNTGDDMALEIPDRHKEGVAALAALDPAVTSQILEALSEFPLGGTRERLTNCFQAGELSESDARAASSIFMNMAAAMADWGIDAESMAQSVGEHAGLTGDAADRFSAFATSVMSIKTIALTARCNDVTTEQARAYCRGRIMTDIRPVYAINDTASIEAASVVHQLHITYHKRHSRSTEDFFVALDHNDLRQLRSMIDRALEKHNTASEALKKLQVEECRPATHED